MTRYVVDTNVAVVANGRDGDYDVDCRIACVEIIRSISQKSRHRTILDEAGAILDEYRRYLNPRGQPGVGDEFYRFLLNFQGNPKRVTLVSIEEDAESGEYRDFPVCAALQQFHRDDRKFVAAAIVGQGVVLNAVDSDWRDFSKPLRKAGVKIKQLCLHSIGSNRV